MFRIAVTKTLTKREPDGTARCPYCRCLCGSGVTCRHFVKFEKDQAVWIHSYIEEKWFFVYLDPIEIEQKYFKVKNSHPHTIEEAWEKTLRAWTLKKEGFINLSPYIGSHSICGLCDLFYDHGCKECPIAKYTGYSQCKWTPWWENPVSVSNPEDINYLPVIQKQIAFLITVRFSSLNSYINSYANKKTKILQSTYG